LIFDQIGYGLGTGQIPVSFLTLQQDGKIRRKSAAVLIGNYAQTMPEVSKKALTEPHGTSPLDHLSHCKYKKMQDLISYR
jgi:hypothetical protein